MIQKSTQNRHWKLSIIVSKIKGLCEGRAVHFQHIFREGNSLADHFAKIALKEKINKEYGAGDCRIRVRKLAYNDKSGIGNLRRC